MSAFIKPKPLERGDAIGVIAPSDAIERGYLRQNVKIVSEWGLKVKRGKHLYSMVGDFAAGTPEERREDIERMIDDPEVKVIWAAEGGYAATEVLPVFNRINIEKLKKNPKWFIGYSDVCILLNALASFKLTGIQGPNFSGLFEKDERSQLWLRRMLFGESRMEIGAESNWHSIIPGEVSGQLLVSNLDSLVTVLGTRYDPLMYGSGDLILGIEEWWIEKSTLQRQIDTIMHHKRAGRIKGVILGRFVGVGEYSYPIWGKDITAPDLIAGRIRLRGGIPMAQLLDFGHPEEDSWLAQKLPKLKKPQTFLALPNGIKAKFVVEPNAAKLTFLESASAVE